MKIFTELDVCCSYCGAKEGSSCTRKGGRPRNHYHKARGKILVKTEEMWRAMNDPTSSLARGIADIRAGRIGHLDANLRRPNAG